MLLYLVFLIHVLNLRSSRLLMALYLVWLVQWMLSSLTILLFKSVLLVTSLRCNLPFIAKLTRDSNCVAQFSFALCSFQDLDSRKMIGNATEKGGLCKMENKRGDSWKKARCFECCYFTLEFQYRKECNAMAFPVRPLKFYVPSKIVSLTS